MGAFGGFIQNSASILPEVPKPTRKPSLTERLIWTAAILILYLTMSHIPLYGVSGTQFQQMEFINIIFASSVGTLMTLGIGPIVTAGLILQLLKGADMIKLDFKKSEDRALFTSATKFLTLIVIVVEAIAYTLGGAFGTVTSMGTFAVIMVQLFAAGILVMLFDELVQKGWGLGSGISLFIMAGVAQSIMWSTFSLIPTADGYIGAIPFTINATMHGNFWSGFVRSGSLPSIFSLIVTILVILLIVYMEGVRIEIPITSTKFRGFSGVYPIKLLYVSNIPVILTSALTANLTFFSQLLWTRFNPTNTNSLFNFIVTYNATDIQAGPTGGLMRYIVSPRNVVGVLGDPLRAVTYVLFMVTFSVIFAKIWVEIGGLSSKAAASSLIDADVQIPGFRRSELSITSVLQKYIPVITVLGGLIIGLLASCSDLTGAFGSGTGLLLMVSITLQYYQILMREQLESTMPRLGALLGKG